MSGTTAAKDATSSNQIELENLVSPCTDFAPSPLLSVTMTSYNYVPFIAKAIDSILAQTFKDFELIIVDDCSTDNSIKVLYRYALADSRIRVIKHTTNVGGTPSLIEACNLARGRYLVNIDSDDWIINSHAFEQQVAILEQNPDVAFVFAPEAQFRNGNCSRLRAPANSNAIWTGQEAIEKILDFYVTHTGTMLQTAAYKAIGGYNPNFRYTLDLKLWIDLCKNGKVAYIHQLLYAYRQHGHSMSNFSDPYRWQYEILAAIESAFSDSFSATVANANSLYRAAIRQSLVAGPLHHIFSNNYKHGWKLYWASLTLYPLDTLFRKQTLVLVARTILGGKLYHKIIDTNTNTQTLNLDLPKNKDFLQRSYSNIRRKRVKQLD